MPPVAYPEFAKQEAGNQIRKERTGRESCACACAQPQDGTSAMLRICEIPGKSGASFCPLGTAGATAWSRRPGTYRAKLQISASPCETAPRNGRCACWNQPVIEHRWHILARRRDRRHQSGGMHGQSQDKPCMPRESWRASHPAATFCASCAVPMRNHRAQISVDAVHVVPPAGPARNRGPARWGHGRASRTGADEPLAPAPCHDGGEQEGLDLELA